MGGMTRREFVVSAGVASLAVAGCARRVARPAGAMAPGTETLRGAAAKSGFLVGCAVDVHRLRDTPAYAALIAAQANLVVAESEMKFGPMRPSPTTFFWDDADFLAAFAEQHGMKLRGHNFVWHRQLPPWFAGYVTPANAKQVLVEHIRAVGGRFRGRVHSWDVVNEAIQISDGLPEGMRDSPWQKVLPGYIDVAFREARAVDPHALLVYNDYGIESDRPDAEAKRQAVLALVRGMQRRGVPIDAVGVQSHITAGQMYGPGLKAFLAEVKAMGLKVLLTEMDVNDRELGPDVAMRDRVVAETYASYLGMTLSDRNVIALLTWGITDRYTWLNGEDNRKDGLHNRCLPFDEDLRPKPAFGAELAAVERR